MLGLVNVWLIVEPVPALAPVMLPVIIPIVQLKLLGAVAASAIFVVPPLQIADVFAVVTTGVGLTVTVIVYGVPVQAVAAVEVGVTMYSTVPAVLLLGLFNVCTMVAPEPAAAPVMPPVIVPMVHA